jgi:hypothetical protein
MNMDRIANIAAAIVGVALVTTNVSRQTTAGVIRATGEAFSGSIRAAMGN